MMNYNATLYYPTIEFGSKEWLWNACLLWDKIYRIVPEGYVPDDRKEIKAIIEESDIVGNIVPGKYATEIFDDFKKVIDESKWACALSETDYMDGNYVRLHEGKADVQLRNLLVAGNKRDSEGFYRVTREFANTYMIYLANYIAKKNNITLTTDYDFSWLCSSFMDYHGNLDDDINRGDNLTELGALTFSQFLPYGIEKLSAKELLSFREKSKDERQLFFSEMQKMSEILMKVDDEKIFNDIINERLREFEKSKENYLKRMRDIKIESVCGVKTVLFPVISTIASAIANVPNDVSNILNLCGVGCGIVGAIWDTKKKLKAETKKYSVNYLVQLSYHLSHNYNNVYFG